MTRMPANRPTAILALSLLLGAAAPGLGEEAGPTKAGPRSRFAPEIRPAVLEPGGVVWIALPAEAAGASVEGRLGDQELIFHAAPGSPPFSLAGIDLETEPGPLPLTLFIRPPGVPGVVIRDTLQATARTFDVQRLEIQEKPYTADRLKRIARERDRLHALWDRTTAARLWDADFTPPLRRMHVTSAFGLRRFINGSPRNPHTGIDLRAAAGDTILAMNAGRVALSDTLYFSGNTIVVDHGEGLYSMYFHLSRALTAAGETVRPGQPLGLAGSTGRATGPHLHWGVVLRGARVDPLKLLELPIRPGP